MALVKSIRTADFREHVRKNGILRIRRRWIENSLPDYELLDAVAVAYGQLAELVHDAHRQMGLNSPVSTQVTTGRTYPEGDRQGRLPCMIGHEEARTLDVWLATGEPLVFKTVERKVDMKNAPALKERYGVDFSEMYAESELAEDHARTLFATARKMFEKDGHHITVAFLLRDGKPLTIEELRPEEHGHKYLMMRNLAHEVHRLGADAVILISESWSAPADPVKPYMRAAESPHRREFLTATIVSKAGEPLYLAAEIQREKTKVSLSETHEHIGGAHYAFAPFYEVWGKKIPAMWISSARTADSTLKGKER